MEKNHGYIGFADNYKGVQNEKKELVYTYEDAVTLTGTGKFHYYILGTLGLALMAVVLETVGVSLLMPVAKCDLNMTTAELGILASSGTLGMALSSHMWGFLADTWGRLKVLRTTILAVVVLSGISVFSTSAWMLIAFRFLVGLSAAGSMASGCTYVGEFHGQSTRSKAIAYLSVFIAMGLVWSPALAIAILPLEIDAYLFGMQFSSWRLFIIASSVPTVLCGIAIQFLPESPRYLLIQGDQERALNILKKSFCMNTGKRSNQYPVEKLVLDTIGTNFSNVHSIKDILYMIWSQTAPIFYRNHFFSTMNLIIQMFVILFIGQGIFMWTPNIIEPIVRNIDNSMSICDAIREPIQSVNHTSADALCSSYADVFTYTIILFMGVIFTFCHIIVGLLITPVGPKRLYFIWMMSAGICGICLIWSKNFYLNIILFIGFLGIGNCAGIMKAISVDYFPSNINAMAICFILLAGRFGAVAGTNIMATYFIDSCDIILTSLGGIIILAGFMSYWLPTSRNKMIKTMS